MSTYLELCQELRQQLGLSGSGPPSVTGQTGMMQRVVTNIKLADLFIQNLWVDWNFLHNEYTATLADGARTITAPTDYQKWDLESIWLDKETDEAINLEYLEYKAFRETYYTGTIETNVPSIFTVKPDGYILIDVNADQTYDFSGDYFKAPVALSADGDIPIIPSQYEQIIIERAKVMYAQYTHDNGLYETANAGFAVCLKLLEQAQLPMHQGTISQPLEMRIIPE